MKIQLLVAALAALVTMSFTSLPSSDARPWELLGVKKVNYGLDRDEIDVTASEGMFTGLKLKVKHSPINMHRLAVHFGNGEVQEFDLRENFRAGSESRILDLPGNRRVIRKIVIWYDTKNLAVGKGMVEVWGRH
ncbi:MAG: DUF2541 family protein [Bacteroidetes bacterium]|nr:DUF2541 family protein [Bacteroidota bacterium]